MNPISYWREKERYYRLLGSHCNQCKRDFYPPVYVCRECGSKDIVDREMPQEGTILTYTILYEAMEGFDGYEPLVLAIIKLDNNVRVLAQIADTKGEDIKIGDRVRMIFRKIREEGKEGTIYYGYKFSKQG
ncbi:MAG: Zn-ribbon domain-containing OB-fold protein [Nitrososphaerales archaeon]